MDAGAGRLSDMFLKAPGILLLISSGVLIVNLKQPSNKSSIPFKKSEINKYILTQDFRGVW